MASDNCKEKVFVAAIVLVVLLLDELATLVSITSCCIWNFYL